VRRLQTGAQAASLPYMLQEIWPGWLTAALSPPQLPQRFGFDPANPFARDVELWPISSGT
jgi:hypothetical protein